MLRTLVLAVAGGVLALAPAASWESTSVATSNLALEAKAGGEGAWKSLKGPARIYHSSTLLQYGDVLVTGGCTVRSPAGCGGATNSAAIYNPLRDAWSKTANMKVARIGHSATLLTNGRVLVAGGCTKPPHAPDGCFPDRETASAEIYNPASRTWSPAGEMKVAHWRHTATLLSEDASSSCKPNCGKVLVVGNGFIVANGADSTGDTNAELFDPATNTWSPTAGSVGQRVAHTAVRLRDGRVLVTGGGTNLDPLPVGEYYQPATQSWKPTGNKEAAPIFKGHTSTLLKDGRVLVSGGQGSGFGSDTTEVYDPSALPDPANASVKGGAWIKANGPPVRREFADSVALNNGEVLIAGGSTSGPSQDRKTPRTADLYDPTTGKWKPTGEISHGYSGHPAGPTAPPSFSHPFTLTLLKSGRVLLVGAGVSDQTPGRIGYGELYTPVSGAESDSPASPGLGSGPRRSLLWVLGALGAGVLAVFGFNKYRARRG